MLCSTFVWNTPFGSGEQDENACEKLSAGQTIKRRSEESEIAWAFRSGEPKSCNQWNEIVKKTQKNVMTTRAGMIWISVCSKFVEINQIIFKL